MNLKYSFFCSLLSTIKYLLIIFIISQQDVFSQESLTLEKAVAICLEKNYGIIIMSNELSIAKNNNSIGNAGFLPKVDIFAQLEKSTTNSKVKTTLGSELDVNDANTDLINASISLKWTIFDGFNMFANQKYLNLLEEIGDLNLKNSIENTLAKLIIQYFKVLNEHRIIDLLTAQVSISEFKYQLADLNFQTGMGSEFDLLKSRVELNFDRLTLEKQKTMLNNSKIYLNELLSRDINTQFEINDSIDINSKMNFEDLKSRMYKTNKNLIIAYKNKMLTETEAQKILSRYYPSIDFKVGYSIYNLNTEASLISKNYYNGLNFGISANLNLFDGFNDNLKYENNLILTNNNEIKINQLEMYLESLLTSTFKEYLDEVSNIELEVENYNLALKNMDIAKESFSIGSISSLEFREVQNNYFKANYMLINAKYLTKVKETELLLLSGQILK